MTDMLSEEHQAWLEGRGIDLEVATRYGLYTDRQSQGGRDLVIPYRRDGKIVNRKYRGPQKQFRQDPGAPRMFWNEDALRDKALAAEPLVVTEGEFDGLAAIQAGFLRTVSVPDGASSNLDFIGDVWPLVKDVRKVILAGDGDEPGRNLNKELARRFGAARCASVLYSDGTKDLNDTSSGSTARRPSGTLCGPPNPIL
jgi:twinkle protein